MSRLLPDPIPTAEITDEALFLRRREFLRGTALVLAGATLPACSRAEEPAAGRETAAAPQEAPVPGATAAPQRARGPVQTSLGEVRPGPAPFATDEAPTPYEDASSYNNFYEFGTDKRDPARLAGSLRTEPWSVAIEGEVSKPGVVPLEDLLRPHPFEERVYRLRCVEAWSMVVPWIGFPLGRLLQRFEPTSNAKYVAFETLHDPAQMPGQRRDVLEWPYREGLRMDEAVHPLAILAVGMYGRVLPNQNGAPLRLVVPWKYGFKSIKSIVRIRLQEREPKTSWNLESPREYGFFANVNPEVDHPRWSQSRERRIGEWTKRPTLFLNGYAEHVAHLYRGMDLRKLY